MTDPTTETEATAKKTPGTKTPGNSGAHPETEPIVPVSVGEVDDAASLAIDQKHMEDFASPDLEPGTVECFRPPKGAFFTSCRRKLTNAGRTAPTISCWR